MTNLRSRNPSNAAFTLVDLAMVLTVIAGFVLISVVYQSRNRRKGIREPRIDCVNQLKQIGLAYRIWSNDHEDRFPWQVPISQGGLVPEPEQIGTNFGEFVHAFLAISNELTVPKILVCTKDTKTRATGFEVNASIPFAGLGLRTSVSNVTYLLGWDADETKPQTILSGDPNCVEGLSDAEGTAGVSGQVKRLAAGKSQVKWNGYLHSGMGNIALADGSVQSMNSTLLSQMASRLGTEGSSGTVRQPRLVVPRP